MKKFPAETRVVLLIFLMLTLSQSLMSIYIYSKVQDILIDHLHTQAKILSKTGRSSAVPYMETGNSPNPPRGFTLFSYTGDRYIYLKEGYLYRSLKGILSDILVIQIITTLSFTLLFYYLFRLFIGKEREKAEFIKLLHLITSHRMGNYLSSIKVNLELLRETHSPKALERMLSITEFLELNHRKNLRILNDLVQAEELQKEAEQVKLKNLIEKTCNSLKNLNPDRNIRIYGHDIAMSANPTLLSSLLELLLENAFKYSRSQIRVKLCRAETKPLLIIRNDLEGGVARGSGIGLQVAGYLSKLLGAQLKTRVKRNHYITLLVLSK